MIELRLEKSAVTLINWRKEVIRNVFDVDPAVDLMEANLEYYRRHISDGSHQAFVATSDGEDAGVGAVCFYEELPSPDNPTGRCAYLMNIYVREKFRNHGIAKKIIGHLVNLAAARGCGKIYLESTRMAAPLYRECGFSDMKNMMKHED